MQSTEICVQIYNNIEIAHQKIIQSGYKFVDKYTELDYYFTHLTNEDIKNINYGKLMSNTILLRTVVSEKDQQFLLIFKNKTLNSKGEVIKEERIQTLLGDMNSAKKLLMASGLNNWCRIQVNEREYLKGATSIHLQNVPQLGLFLEVKQPINNNLRSETVFQDLVYDANALGLDLGKDYSCKKNYMLYKKQLTK